MGKRNAITIGVFGGITKGALHARAKITSSSLQFTDITAGRTESPKILLLALPRIKKLVFVEKNLLIPVEMLS